MRQLSPKHSNFWFMGIAFLASLTLFFFQYGYDYGGFDHDEILSLVHKSTDPSLYSKDIFHQQPLDVFHVRYFSTQFMAMFSQIMGTQNAFLWAYLLSWLSICCGLFKIAEHLTRSAWTATISVVATLALSHKMTLGHNDFVYIQYSPEILGWAFAVWGMFHAFRRETWVLSALFLGITTLFHPVLGLGNFFLWMLMQLQLNFKRPAVLLIPCLIYGAISLYSLVPQLFTFQNNREAVFQLITQIRLAVHFNPLHFGTNLVTGFAWICGLGTLGWISTWGELMVRTRLKIRSWVIASIILFIIAIIALFPLIHQSTLYQFQFWKLSVWLKFLLMTGLVFGVLHFIGERTQAVASPIFFFFIFFGIAGFTVLQTRYPNSRIALQQHHLIYQNSDLGQLEAWIAKNTPHTALFVLPPDNTTFRNTTKRSVYATWLAFPFREQEMMIWKQRMDILTALPNNERWTSSQTNHAFYSKYQNRWATLLAETHADYLLLNTQQSGSTAPLKVVKSIGEWQLLTHSGQP